MDKKIVIIPTYNEKENIEAITRKVFSLPGDFQILIIDDGSPDGTATIVKGLQTEFPDRLHLLERSGKQGLGTAYLTGFKWSLDHGYDYIFEMDADFSHNPDDLLRLYAACAEQGADLAVGSRYCHGVSVVDWPMSRIIMSYYASAYVRGILGMKVFDTTAGFVCYTRKVLETMLGFKISEVPIIFTNRQLGTSKMSSGIFGEAFGGVIRLKFRRIRKKQ